jgi:hypothetical protein
MISPARPAISVVMSVFNAERYVAGAIASILTQSFGDFEFLILNDGSTDGSEAIIAAYARRDPRIRVISRENRGLIASLNQLLDMARAPLIARMDADDLSAPDRLERQMAFLATHPEHGLVGTDCRYIGPDGQALSLPQSPRPLSDAQLRRNLESGPLLTHTAVVYARAAAMAVGGYRHAFTHAEDYDLWLRLSQVTRMANLPEKLVSYRVHPDQVSDRHLITQARNAGIAWLCHRERLAGRADPVERLGRLPALGELDALFGRGAEDLVRRRVIDRSLYAPAALASEGWEMLKTHARRHRDDPRLWRLAARMLRDGKPLRAGQLGMMLITA